VSPRTAADKLHRARAACSNNSQPVMCCVRRVAARGVIPAAHARLATGIASMQIEYGGQCHISGRPYTVFRWRPGSDARYKKTIICQEVAKAKNVCQVQLLACQRRAPTTAAARPPRPPACIHQPWLRGTAHAPLHQCPAPHCCSPPAARPCAAPEPPSCRPWLLPGVPAGPGLQPSGASEGHGAGHHQRRHPGECRGQGVPAAGGWRARCAC
jgi:hypothetical protein